MSFIIAEKKPKDIKSVCIGIFKKSEYDKKMLFLIDKKDAVIQCSNIEIKEGELWPMPDFKEHEKLYVSGPSKAGKSYYISQWVRKWLKKDKTRDVVIISGIDEDKNLDDLSAAGVYRVDINESLYNLTPEDLEHCIVIFDDVSLIMDKDLRYAANLLQDTLLKGARHHDIVMCSTSHILLDRFITQTLILECTSMTMFPQSLSRGQIIKYLRDYIAFDKYQIKKFINLPSRWVTLYKTKDPYIIYEKGCYLVNQD